MNGKDLAILHGEKILLAVIVGLSGWAAYSTVNNPAVHPKDATDLAIDGMIARIESARETQAAPQIRMPPNYVLALSKRLDGELPASSYISWMSGTPDVGPTVGNSQQVYIYELLPPHVTGDEHVGMIEVSVSMPEVIQPTDGSRISDGTQRVWKAQGGAIVNTVERVGILMEYSVGSPTGSFLPLEAEGATDGFIPLTSNSQTSVTAAFRPKTVWETYYVRASVVIKATGYPLDQPEGESPSQSILVYQGRFGAPPIWSELESKIHSGDASMAGKFLRPLEKTFASVPLKGGEKLYVSKADLGKPILVTSATRFAFEKPTGDGTTLGASVLVTTLLPPLPGATDAKSLWLSKPEIYKIKKGDKLGDVRLIPDPRKLGRKSQIDLTTPFVLAEIKPEVERILYYELITKSRATGGGQRDLDYKIKSKLVEGAVFRNPATGQEMTYARMVRIEKPQANLPSYRQVNAGQWNPEKGPFIYPNFPGLAYDEAEEFRKNPADFKQRPLKPLEPIWHDANETSGPLVEMRKRAGDDYQTDTRYVEFPDGRVFFWDPYNKRILGFTLPNAEADVLAKKDSSAVPAPAVNAGSGAISTP